MVYLTVYDFAKPYSIEGVMDMGSTLIAGNYPPLDPHLAISHFKAT
jgi:hypothetical protein